MPDARDAEDTQLLEEGHIARLLAKYQPIIRGRCVARVRGADADDVAQNVMVRLYSEFQKGKRYRAPYRVVVHQVISWTISDYFENRDPALPLPEDWEPAAPDASEDVVQRHSLHSLFGSLPEKTRRVLELRYLLGFDHEQIADELGMERNAVDQALNRGHSKLREALAHG